MFARFFSETVDIVKETLKAVLRGGIITGLLTLIITRRHEVAEEAAVTSAAMSAGSTLGARVGLMVFGPWGALLGFLGGLVAGYYQKGRCYRLYRATKQLLRGLIRL